MLLHVATFTEEVDQDAGFASFIALCRSPAIHDEQHFEKVLWAQLQGLHTADREARQYSGRDVGATWVAPFEDET